MNQYMLMPSGGKKQEKRKKPPKSLHNSKESLTFAAENV